MFPLPWLNGGALRLNLEYTLEAEEVAPSHQTIILRPFESSQKGERKKSKLSTSLAAFVMGMVNLY